MKAIILLILIPFSVMAQDRHKILTANGVHVALAEARTALVPLLEGKKCPNVCPTDKAMSMMYQLERELAAGQDGLALGMKLSDYIENELMAFVISTTAAVKDQRRAKALLSLYLADTRLFMLTGKPTGRLWKCRDLSTKTRRYVDIKACRESVPTVIVEAQ